MISFACKLGLDHCVGISFFCLGFEALMLDFNGFSCISSGVAVMSVECVVGLCGFLKFFALGEVKVEVVEILFPRWRRLDFLHVEWSIGDDLGKFGTILLDFIVFVLS